MRFRLFASALALLTLLTACQTTPDANSSSSASMGDSSSVVSVGTSSVSSSQPASSAQAESSSVPEAEVPATVPESSLPVVSEPVSSAQTASEPPIVSPRTDNLLVLAERADEISVLMEPQQPSIPVDAKELTLVIINGSEQEVTGDMYFTLEKKEDDQWHKVRFKDDAAFLDLAQIIRPGETAEQVISLEQFAQPLTSGDYRVTKQFSGPKRAFPLTTEFTLGAAEGRLELKKPNSIKLSIGSGKKTVKATLTLKQRYAETSTVSFAMEQLEEFVPLADNQKMIVAEGSEGALLTLIYPDGLQRELLIDPLGSLEQEDGRIQPVTRLLDGQQWYYSTDVEIYDRLYDCAVTIDEAAK